MNTKLTLNLNKDTIESAKNYAKNNDTSVSKLIENYLNSLIKKNDKSNKVSPLVQSLTGVIPKIPDEEFRREYYDYLNEKYS